jgi:hypothetical protein
MPLQRHYFLPHESIPWFYAAIMSELRIHFRYGAYELELEGMAEAVERQFETIRRMLAPPNPEPAVQTPAPTAPVAEETAGNASLDSVVRMRGKICSLAAPAATADAVLLILMAQRHYRKNEAVSGLEIMEGLRDSGIRVPRVDTVLTRHVRSALVVVTGRHRRRRYRLSLSGVERAQQIARNLIGKRSPQSASAGNPVSFTETEKVRRKSD